MRNLFFLLSFPSISQMIRLHNVVLKMMFAGRLFLFLSKQGGNAAFKELRFKVTVE